MSSVGMVLIADRPADGLDGMIDLKVSFDTDKQTAMADTRYWAALALWAEEKTSVEDPLQMERLADALPLEWAASRWIVSIDPDEQVERVRSYVELVELGFRHPVFRARAGPGQIPPSLYSEQVIPRLRAAFG
jgi:coenzyme F420-dependent glucose-6-phosphate dehydrogenase